MLPLSRSHSLLPLPLLTCLVGVAFSVWNVVDAASVPCFSAGCTLYQNFALHGISLWWGGIVAFGVLSLLAFGGRAEIGRLLAGIGLWLDSLLFIVMLLTLPCFACMIVGILLACSYLAFVHASAQSRRRIGHSPEKFLSLPLGIWLICFLLLSGVSLNSFMQPWSIQLPQEGKDAVVHIFFSPSCTACRRLVMQLPQEQARNVAWYPVAEEEQDLAVIRALHQRLEEKKDTNVASALNASLTVSAPSTLDFFTPEMLFLRFRLWRNQASVLKSGGGILPFVAFRGVPASLIHAEKVEKKPTSSLPSGPASVYPESKENLDATLPIDLNVAGMCGEGVPCP